MTEDAVDVVQHDDSIVGGYSGLEVSCPFCREDESLDHVPVVKLRERECHVCGREFEIEVHWHE
jgi:hypothetical protein